MVDYRAILSEIQEVYLSDEAPWIVGFSGGKDSTMVLQMVFYALSALPKGDLLKSVHVLSNDTLVENPVVAGHVDEELRRIETAGKTHLFKHRPDLFSVARVKPRLEDTFWVNLIGRGYPSPNRWFRWCTERLKIVPTNSYIVSTVNGNGRATTILGTRKAESANRAASMNNYNEGHRLRRHTLPNAFIYTPIADLSNHEVWAYLLQAPNPWGSDNRNLLRMYRDACSGGECPFMIETGTQSCGKSRFGCWVCTVVDRDQSMENLIENGQEWMMQLLEFRDWLYAIRQQRSQYVPKDLGSSVKFGPFLLKARREILDKLLGMQERLAMQLITPDELGYIDELLEKESEGKVEEGLREFVFELPNGKCVVTISDFNTLLTPRKRLGPLHLKRAKLIESRKLSANCVRSTRVIYYVN